MAAPWHSTGRAALSASVSGRDAGVGAQEGPRLGHVELEVRLEAPGVQADGDVVGQEVGGGEVEVDQAGQAAVEEEDVVGEQVGVDVAGGKVLRPGGQDGVQRGR